MSAPLMTHECHVQWATEQMSRKQDYVISGDNDNFFWIFLADGHGTDSCIYCIRTLSKTTLNEIFQAEDPILSLAKYIDAHADIDSDELSGATAIVIKVFPDRAECFSSGDSQFVVFQDNALVHLSRKHDGQNEDERLRVEQLGGTFVSVRTIDIRSTTELCARHVDYAVFPHLEGSNRMLACTQAVGHNSQTGLSPEKFVIPLKDASTYRFLAGSDGFFDMVYWKDFGDIMRLQNLSSSRDLCNWSMGRWLQSWDAVVDGTPKKIQFERHECDDISVALIDIYPVPANKV